MAAHRSMRAPQPRAPSGSTSAVGCVGPQRAGLVARGKRPRQRRRSQCRPRAPLVERDRRQGSRILLAFRAPFVVGHVDWESQNIRWQNGQPLVVHDWDSAATRPEATIVGAAAAVFARSGDISAATVEESDAFLDAINASVAALLQRSNSAPRGLQDYGCWHSTPRRTPSIGAATPRVSPTKHGSASVERPYETYVGRHCTKPRGGRWEGRHPANWQLPRARQSVCAKEGAAKLSTVPPLPPPTSAVACGDPDGWC